MIASGERNRQPHLVSPTRALPGRFASALSGYRVAIAQFNTCKVSAYWKKISPVSPLSVLYFIPAWFLTIMIIRLISILLGAILFFAAYSEENDETQIARNRAAIEEAVEQKNFSAIDEYLDSSFVANEHMGIDEVSHLLRLYSLQHGRLGVTIIASNTTMHKNMSDRADTIVSVIATGSSGLLPSDGSIRRVELEWIKNSGSRQIRKAAWRH